MKPFLYRLAKVFFDSGRDNLKDYTFVFPSRRAELFFMKYLSEVSAEKKNPMPVFSPSTLTIDDFVSQLSGYSPADRIEMLFLLYNNYIKFLETQETFDDFYYWADILLSDFDDVDKYLVDPKKLFSNIYELKEIDSKFGIQLSDDQKAFLMRFIKNFNFKDGDTGSKEKFISLWKIMYNLYAGLKSDLEERGCAYNGMMLRSIIERINKSEITVSDIETRYKKLVFVGFNLLSTAEEKMMSQLRDMKVADFYWDYNIPGSDEDKYSTLSLSMKQNILNFPSANKLGEPQIESFPEIEIVAIPSNIGQARYAGEIINGLSLEEVKESNTVVVLADEKLLLPMLYTLPSTVDTVNITMGYPLSETPLYSLFKAMFDMLLRAKKDDNNRVRYYHRDVLSLLKQPYLRMLHRDVVKEFSEYITINNIVYIYDSIIPDEIKYLFISNASTNDIFVQINTVIDKLLKGETQLDLVTKEFLFYYKTVVNRLQAIANEFEIKEHTLFKLIEKMSSGVKVPFSGEPLSGLQIMGVLETRALDFDNVIILSMNEGVFPIDSRGETFIPYNVRKGFGMSTYEQRDEMAEYYFYRLISRAKKVYMTYDTRAEGGKTGDVSRFVHQLKYQYSNRIKSFVEKNVNYTVKLSETEHIEVKKNNLILGKLEEFYKEGGSRKLSASSLNDYIDCPLRFYFAHVEKIATEDKVLEDLDASVFGTIFHEIMQKLYEDKIGTEITKEVLEEMLADTDRIDEIMLKSFARNYYKSKTIVPLTGRLSLRGEVIKKMVKKTLELDKGRTPFVMLQTELKIETTVQLPSGNEVKIKGIIDRLDLKDDSLNIIDYKSGKVYFDFENIDSLFISREGRRKQVFQVLFYVYLLKKAIKDEVTKRVVNEKVSSLMACAGISSESHGKTFAPGLYSIVNYFADYFQWQIRKKAGNSYVTYKVEPECDVYNEYEEKLENILVEMFDKDQLFNQTQDKKVCEFCPFIDLCRR
jgi:hypothetical protein